MPRYPKPDAERRNSNRPAFEWTILPAEGRPGPPPRLPAGRKWSSSTRSWWKALWRSPQAVCWAPDDPELHRLALLHEVVWAAAVPPVGLLAEMRQIEDRHGLNPKAMLQLRWMVAEAAAAPAARPAGQADRARRDRMMRLADAG